MTEIAEIVSNPPASRLTGLKLDGGWKVKQQVDSETGANFSCGYIVFNEESGRKGFLKALDYSKALLLSDNPAEKLNELTDEFLFEKKLLFKCKNKNLDRIVQPVDVGDVSVDVEPKAYSTVQYIIFEKAEGDIRDYASELTATDTIWKLQCIHDVAVGLDQLHRSNIAHQDVKPSNVLTFNSGNISKLADLARGAYKGHEAPHEHFDVAGDPTYSPPELLYGYVPNNWETRRRGCDLYNLGCLISILFSGINMTNYVKENISQTYHPERWQGKYEQVLPYIKTRFAKATKQLERDIASDYSAEISSIVSQLCHPAPQERGHPKERGTTNSNYSLERYVSEFDLLIKRIKIEKIKNE